jgi:2-dehydro-3-deoxygluconokinase
VVMDGAAWLHVTGITPALGANAAAATRSAIDAARVAGAKVSLDLNYRKRLWTEAQAQHVMRPLATGVDLLIANEDDLQSVLGVPVADADVTQGHLSVTSYGGAAERVSREFAVGMVALTLRESLSASDNGWSGLLWDSAARALHVSQHYDLRVVDRIGGGDSFGAGLIYGLVTGRTPEASLRFAVAASALKHSIPGDFNRVSVGEVDRLAAGDRSGRVQR